ncbi:hypothetical protein AB0H77_15135 [Streptomyces sp. NPDC050844]|uniref:hypothetical protein n=1 Tax=Streptomyces sp. NPDC050844 TaxID=3155790 RepID=UPI0033C1D830
MTSSTTRIVRAIAVPARSIRPISAIAFANRAPAARLPTTALAPPVRTDSARPAISTSMISRMMTLSSVSSSWASSANLSSASAPSRSESAIVVACERVFFARLLKAVAVLPSQVTSFSACSASLTEASIALARERHFLAISRTPSGSTAGSEIPRNSIMLAMLSPAMWLNLLM